MIPKTIQFTILPSTPSLIFEMVIVVTLFLILNIYIVYLSAYDSGYRPNFVLLLSFIFDDTTSLRNFKTYIQNVAIDKVSVLNSNSKIKSKESFSNRNDNILSTTIFWLKKKFVKLFIKGNRIHTTQLI